MENKKIILVVEDETPLLNALRDRLRREGFTVLEATDGKHGLEMAKEHRPNLILLDNLMPELDGMSMLEELRKDPFGKSIKVIILTNFEANSTILTKIVKTQPAYYFMKSNISLDKLVEKINELLSKKPVAGPPKDA